MTRPIEMRGPNPVPPTINEILSDLTDAMSHVDTVSNTLMFINGQKDADDVMACGETTLRYTSLLLDRVLDELRILHNLSVWPVDRAGGRR